MASYNVLHNNLVIKLSNLSQISERDSQTFPILSSVSFAYRFYHLCILLSDSIICGFCFPILSPVSFAFRFYHMCLLLSNSIICVFCFPILSSVSFAFRFYHLCLLLSDSIIGVFCFPILSSVSFAFLFYQLCVLLSYSVICVFCFPILSPVSFAFLFYHVSFAFLFFYLCLLLLQTPDRAKLATPLCCTIIIVFYAKLKTDMSELRPLYSTPLHLPKSLIVQFTQGNRGYKNMYYSLKIIKETTHFVGPTF